MKRIIFESHSAGFFSNFNKVVQALSVYYNQIGEVIWKMQGPGMGQYHPTEEIYNKLFIPYKSSSVIEEVCISKYIDVNYTAHHVAEIYQNTDQTWKYQYNKAYNTYIKHTSFLEEVWNKNYLSFFEKAKNKTKIGILIRNQQLSTEQPRRVLPNREAYQHTIKELKLDDYVIFCGIDNKHDLSFFENNYNVFYNKNVTRTNFSYDGEPHLRDGLTIVDAAYHYLESYALSKCDFLIHPVSNMATAAMYMNPELKNIFLIG